jgi:RNase P/RNase MRP subunit p30
MAKILAIDVLGFDYKSNNNNNKVEEGNIIYRINIKLLSSSVITGHPYLVISENINELRSTSSPDIDLFVVRDFERIDNTLKRKVKSGMGLEANLADIRKMTGWQVGKWLNQIRKLHKFCRSSNCQFILSSGASSALEMISGPSFDAILRICDIKPESYWRELGDWIESKCHGRCL